MGSRKRPYNASNLFGSDSVRRHFLLLEPKTWMLGHRRAESDAVLRTAMPGHDELWNPRQGSSLKTLVFCFYARKRSG